MELRDFVRDQWVVPLIAVPIATGMVALLVLSLVAEEEHSATAVISLSDGISGDQTVAGRIDEFELTLGGSTVANQVAAATDLAPDAVRDGFSTERSGASSLVEVEFVAGSADDARDGLAIGVTTALDQMTGSAMGQAEVALNAAARQRSPAEAELRQLQDEHGTADLEGDYRALSTDILQLRNTIAESFGQPERQEQLEQLLEAKEEERDALGEDLAAWQEAQRAFDSGTAAETAAQSQIFVVEAARERWESIDLAESTSVDSQSGFASVALPTLAAMVVAFGVVFLASVVTHRRETTEAAAVDRGPGDEPGTDGFRAPATRGASAGISPKPRKPRRGSRR